VSLTLGIESSCDETAAAVVRGDRDVRSSIVATQHELHELYNGVVPEIASRAHLECIGPVVDEALKVAGISLGDLDAIAVGHAPGLIGSLLVGVSAAKTLSWSLGIPLTGVHHLLAHLHAPALDSEAIAYPAVGLLASGGHTSLTVQHGPLEARLLGHTIDDAVGEAFDKAGTLLEAGYPGGPAIERLAQDGDDRAVELPIANLGRDSLDFSFAGLKTALLYATRGTPVGRGQNARFPRTASDLTQQRRADLAASFQRCAIEALTRRAHAALEATPARTLLGGGGVLCNTLLRTSLTALADRHGVALRIAPPAYCVDNAAMIAGLGHLSIAAGHIDGTNLQAKARLSIEDATA